MNPILRKVIATATGLVSALYLINPTFGVFEFLPDNIPIVGNLDESFFTWVLIASLAALGIELPLMRRR
jgi:hypothetical protein